MWAMDASYAAHCNFQLSDIIIIITIQLHFNVQFLRLAALTFIYIVKSKNIDCFLENLLTDKKSHQNYLLMI